MLKDRQPGTPEEFGPTLPGLPLVERAAQPSP